MHTTTGRDPATQHTLGSPEGESSRASIFVSFLARLFAHAIFIAASKLTRIADTALPSLPLFSKPFTPFECFTLSPARLTLRDALLQPPLAGLGPDTRPACTPAPPLRGRSIRSRP
jgi:hypothetical protein